MNWQLMPSAAPPAELLAVCQGPLLARLLAQRGIADADSAKGFLNPDHYAPVPASAMVGVVRAARMLRRCLDRRQPVLVWGDFDADGQTSTALLVSALRELAAERTPVHWHIPHRVRDNHGVQAGVLTDLLPRLSPRPALIITCDTGIDAVEGLRAARQAGLDVIVTDHHALPPEFDDHEPGTDPCLPTSIEDADLERWGVRCLADTIVNPQLMPPEHPQAHLPGVGVAFLVVQQLISELEPMTTADRFLDLVAVGIVADMADQKADTRYWLQRGLVQLARTERIGLETLLDESLSRVQWRKTGVRAEHIAFQVAPRLNAVSRLESAETSVELLLTRDRTQAEEIARKLTLLNERRKDESARIAATTRNLLAARPEHDALHCLVIAHRGWHPGLLGIAASRIVEETGKPSIVLTITEEGVARGSARSVDGIDIGRAIGRCSDLLLSHGGHAGAAGVRLEVDRLEEFRRRVSEEVAALHGDGPAPRRADLELRLDELNPDTHRQLEALEPTGAGNPQPVLLSRELAAERPVRSRDGKHLFFSVRQAGHRFASQAKWFNAPPGMEQVLEGPINLLYHLALDTYRRRRSFFLLVRACESVDQYRTIAPESPVRTVPFTIEDLRASPAAELPNSVRMTTAWYAAGAGMPETYVSILPALKGMDDRDALTIWTAPPTRKHLEELLQARAWSSVAVRAAEPQGTPLEIDHVVDLFKERYKRAWASDSPATNDIHRQDGASQSAACTPTAVDASGIPDLIQERWAAEWGLTREVMQITRALLQANDFLHITGDLALPGPDRALGARNDDWHRRKSIPLMAQLRTALHEIKAFHALLHREDLTRHLAAVHSPRT